MQSRSRKLTKPVKDSLVPPVVAAIASLVPGLGHLLARAWRKGLIILASTMTMVGLLAWRMKSTARFDPEPVDIFLKSIRLKPVLLLVSILVVVQWIIVILDAYRHAQRPQRNFPGVFLLILLIFFGLGWQIGGIDPITLVTETQRGGVILRRVVWPWEAATTRLTEEVTPSAKIQVPCTEEVITPEPAVEGEPYLQVEPICGKMTTEDGVQGTLVTLTVSGLQPGTTAELWWADPIGNKFRQRIDGDAVEVTTDENGQATVAVPIPYRLIPPSAREGAMIWTVEFRQEVEYGDLIPSESLILAIEAMIETIFLGMMSTAFGIVLALPLSFMAARNLMRANWFTLGIYYVVRLMLNIIRSIEPMIWAVIAIIIVGLGPFAGIIALTVHSIAALGKLYSESIESIDPGPIEAIQATGANWIQTVMYAVVPQIIPPFVSFTIYRWDINVRMSTVIGLVGGGGIGLLLIQWLRIFDYSSAGIAVWFIALTVAVLDFVSSDIRQRFV